MQILIVDGDSDLIDYANNLRTAKLEIVIKHTAETAKEWLKTHNPDKIIINPVLPLSSGMTVINHDLKSSIVINTDLKREVVVKKLNGVMSDRIKILDKRISSQKDLIDIIMG